MELMTEIRKLDVSDATVRAAVQVDDEEAFLHEGIRRLANSILIEWQEGEERTVSPARGNSLHNTAGGGSGMNPRYTEPVQPNGSLGMVGQEQHQRRCCNGNACTWQCNRGRHWLWGGGGGRNNACHSKTRQVRGIRCIPNRYSTTDLCAHVGKSNANAGDARATALHGNAIVDGKAPGGMGGTESMHVTAGRGK